MTTNRAQKRAARAIAAAQNIRYPEAVALADDRAQPDSRTPRQEITPIDLQKARILFARRYADLLVAGLDWRATLNLLKDSLSELPGMLGQEFRDAIAGANEDLKVGAAAGEAWAPYKELLGLHLYQMLKIMGEAGNGIVLLRNAADTLEAEMRLGLD